MSRSEDFLKFLDETPSKEEVANHIKTLTDFVKEAKKRLEELSEKKSRELDATVADVLASISEIDTRATARADADKEAMYSESRTLMRLMEQKIEDIEALIPESYDDTALRSEIEKTKALIPTLPDAFDPSSILAELKALSTRVEALEAYTKRVRETAGNSGGGITNLRIQQAFKYILKTEAPTGAINGSNTTYTVSQPIFAVLSFSLNGETIAQIPNYTVKGRTITFATALPAAYSGKDFEIRYI